MAECPDCDNILIRLPDSIGDGKCSDCHGTGIDAADAMINILSDEHPCNTCNGTGQCQTCGGTGEV